jgi:phosphomannomutase
VAQGAAQRRCRASLHRRIVGDVKLARPMKIVIDCGNGVAGASRRPVPRLGCEVVELFCEVDGTSPTTTPTRPSPRTCRT